ncbi:MAG TPA: hypothetical protein VMN77_08460 [Nitrospiria bacterium]|jgi:O-antigen ligase|nr:hypothetical protein [Nitrospiria bacterium]
MLLLSAISLSIVALITLAVNPIAGIPLLFMVKPVVDAVYLEPLLFGLRLPELVGGLAPMIVFVHMLFVGPERALGRMPLRSIWIVYAVDVCVFSMIIAYDQSFMEGVNIFLRYINGFVGFYMVQAFFYNDPEKNLRRLLLALIVAGFFPIGIGVYQMATGAVWKSASTEGITRYIGLYHDAFTVRFYAFQTIFALVLYGALYGGRNLFIKGSVLAYCVASTVAMIGAYSKAGVVSLVMWVTSWALLQKKIALFLLIILCGGILGIYYAPQIAANITQMFHKEIGALEGKVKLERTFAGRWYGWEEMISRWEEFNWLKKGFGSGEVAVGAHNDYLQMLFHGGIFGLMIYLFLLSAVGWTIVSNLRTKIDPMSIAAFMLLLMWLVDAIGLVPSSYPGYQWFVWGFIGLSLRVREEVGRAAERPDLSQEATLSRELPGGLALPPALTAERRFPSLLR